jgi:hypothetical protein
MDISGHEAIRDKTRFDNGVIISQFFNPLTLESVLSMQDQALELLAGKGIECIPYIIVLSGAAQSQILLGRPDMGKMVEHEFTKHIAGIWVVGRTESHKQIMDNMNHFFFSDRMHFVDSVEEATSQAKQSVVNDLNLFERNRDEE